MNASLECNGPSAAADGTVGQVRFVYRFSGDSGAVCSSVRMHDRGDPGESHGA